MPVGCVIVRGRRGGRPGHNRRENGTYRPGSWSWTPSRQACGALGGMAAEPLRPVCDAGALPHVRRGHHQRPHPRPLLRREEEKAGCCGSVLNLFENASTTTPHLRRRAGGGVLRPAPVILPKSTLSGSAFYGFHTFVTNQATFLTTPGTITLARGNTSFHSILNHRNGQRRTPLPVPYRRLFFACAVPGRPRAAPFRQADHPGLSAFWSRLRELYIKSEDLKLL